jgi:uncharacterized protein (TIGR03435 family)
MAGFTAMLAANSGLPVVDQTGITGYVAYHLEFVRESALTASADAATLSSVSEGRPLNVAVREQLGLKLESGNVPVRVLVIDSVQPPTEN